MIIKQCRFRKPLSRADFGTPRMPRTIKGVPGVSDGVRSLQTQSHTYQKYLLFDYLFHTSHLRVAIQSNTTTRYR